MIIKRTLKSTLPALALAATVTATYAVDDNAVVTLANGGGNISWAQFVSAIWNPNTVNGKIEDLPEDNAAREAYDNAVSAKNKADKALETATSKQTAANTAKEQADQAVEDAEGVVTTKTTAYNTAKQTSYDAQATVTNDSTAVVTAQAGLVTAQEAYIKGFEAALTEAQAKVEPAQKTLDAAYAAYIEGFQNQLDNAQKQLTKWENIDLPGLKSTSSSLAQQKTTVAGQLQQAETNLENAQTQYEALDKVKGTLPWLSSMITNCVNWQTTLEGGTIQGTLSPMYAKVQKYTSLGDEYNDLYISFIKPSDLNGWTTCENYSQYETFITPIVLSNIDYIYVYMGDDYAKLNSGVNRLSITKPNKKGEIFALINEKIVPLADQAKYQGETDEYAKPDLEKRLRENITKYQADVDKYSLQLYGSHKQVDGKWEYGATEETEGIMDQIATNDAAILKMEGDIKTYTDTTIPGYETDLENAKTAVANKTATSDAITAAKTALETANTAVSTATTNLENAKADIDNATSEEITAAKKAISDAKTKLAESKGALASAQEAEQAAKEALDTAKTDLATKQGLQTTAANTLAAANTEVEQANANVEAAEEALATATRKAQTAANQYAYTRFYSAITLNDDIAAAATNVDYTGKIYGKGHIITVNSGSLFNTFSGNLNNAAINGSLAETLENASFTDVVHWTGTMGRYYNESGTSTDYNGKDAFGKLGYALRNDKLFGVNFQTGSVVTVAEAPSLVYDITVNDFDGNEVNTQYYVQDINGTLISYNKATVEIPVNRFAKSQDEIDFPNVYYGVNNTCSLVKIDDSTKGDFYCPVDIQTKNVDMNRTFSKGYNTVCLPFSLNYGYSDNITALCTYEKEGTDKFWFTKVGTSIPANTPVLVVSNADNVELNISNLSKAITILKTDASQMVKGSVSEDDGSTSFGTFKYTLAGEFLGESNSQYIYGLNKSGQFQAANPDAAHFPAFRMVIGTATNHAANAPMRAPGAGGSDIKGIGILDEDGNDITGNVITGVDNITVDNNATESLNVTAGQGILTFTSEADYGDVAIYSIDGKVAAIANVTAGTSTVSLQHGVYIVLGKKYLVK